MLQVRTIREQTDLVKAGLKKRGYDQAAIASVDEVIRLDDQRKSSQTSLDALLSEIKKTSDSIGDLFRSGKAAEANAMKEKVAALKEDAEPLEVALKSAVDGIRDILFKLPNTPHAKVPEGLSEDDNVVIKDWEGALPDLHDGAIPHWDLATKYNIIDFKLGVKIAGAGFPLYRGKGARFQRALINFFLDEAREAGYEEILPPHLVNEDSGIGTGSLPDKEGQMYHMDCFRREAGSYGSDVKGLNRVHQFDKVEIVQVQHPDKSHETLDQMVTYVEGILSKLGLPYRILRLCAGDLTFASALTYDFEVYSAAQDKWLEVSSVSNFETFQTNRMKCRFKDANGKTQLAHTLNGSALALARIVASLLENYQTPDGIVVPEVLRSYTGFDMID